MNVNEFNYIFTELLFETNNVLCKKCNSGYYSRGDRYLGIPKHLSRVHTHRKEISVLDQFPGRLIYSLINRSRSLYSYAENILEDMGYKGYNIKIFFLLILTILIETPFDSDFKIVPLRIL